MTRFPALAPWVFGPRQTALLFSTILRGVENSPIIRTQFMKRTHLLAFVSSLLISVGNTAIDGPAIERASGLKGTFNEPEGVFKISAPRTDVAITVDNGKMPPFMGLTSWAAFMPGKAAEA